MAHGEAAPATRRLRPRRGAACADLIDIIVQERTRIAQLEKLINTPHTGEFLESVRLEAAHQIARWGSEHDAGKTGYYGWEAGRTGLDVADGEEMRAAAWVGALWPLVLVAVAVFAVPFAVSWILRRFSDA